MRIWRRKLGRKLRNSQLVWRRRVKLRTPFKLDLGGIGRGTDGYVTVNLDLDAWSDYWADITKLDKIGIKDGSVDEIYLSHTFEHIDLNTIDNAITTWYRKLKHGGVLRIKGPNIEEYCNLFKKGVIDEEVMIHLMFSHYPRVLKQPLMAHRWAWTKPFLTKTLKQHGFQSVEEYDAGGWQFDLEWFPEHRNIYLTDVGIVAKK